MRDSNRAARATGTRFQSQVSGYKKRRIPHGGGEAESSPADSVKSVTGNRTESVASPVISSTKNDHCKSDSGAEDDVARNQDEGSGDWQAFSKKMAKYRVSSPRSEASLEDTLLGSQLCDEATGDSGNASTPARKPLAREEQSRELEIIVNNADGSDPRSQSSSMTDSSILEDATDWEEDSGAEISTHQSDRDAHCHFAKEMEGKSTLFNILEPMKKQIVDGLMEDFWIYFNQNWPSGVQQRPGASSTSASTFGSAAVCIVPARTASDGNSKGHQTGGGRQDKDPDENNEKGLGGNGKQPESAPNTNQTAPGFACPYRKHNPRKYCVKDWRSCALGAHKTVSRLK